MRVHTDATAAASARALGARAWTYAGHIAFEAGEWAPDTVAGRRLLAHEVAHVVQGGAGTPLRRSLAPPGQEPDPRQDGPVPMAGASPQPPSRPRPAPRAEPCPPPPTLDCEPASSSPGAVTNTLLFPVDSAVLTPRQRAEIDAAVAAWHATGGGVMVRVDGYASADGPCL